MRRPSLGTLLAIVNAALALAAIGTVYLAGATVLRGLANEQAKARVRLASDSTLAAIERTRVEARRSARLLAERPSLSRLLSTESETDLVRFLDDFRATSGLAGAAIADGGNILVTSHRLDDWPTLVAKTSEPEGSAIIERATHGPLIVIAWAPVGGHGTRRVLVARLLDDAFLRAHSDELGLPVTIRTLHTLEHDGTTPETNLGLESLEGSATTVRRLENPGRHVAAAPLRGPDGAPVGAAFATLDADVVATPLHRLAQRLGLLAVLAGAGFALVAPVIARLLTRPIEDLRKAAARLGRGDFSSPIPRVGTIEIAALAGTMEDLRERILRLTSELERRRNESESILNGISEGVFAVDRERRLRYLNPQAAAMLGLQEDTAIGRFCGDVLRPRAHGGQRPCESRCPILHARFRGESRATELLEGQDGQVRTVVVTSAPPLDSESKDAHAGMQLQVMRDETDVEAGRRLRDSVLANISHEFRTPLSAQLASIELLRDRLPDLSREDMLELVRALERGSLRLARLVDNLLESTRIEAGELSLRRHPVAIDTIVEEAVGLTAPLIEQRSQRLDVDLPYPLPELSGDGPRLVQVLVNLLANANKFAPVGSRIGVRVTVGDTHVRIAVDDEGPGLPEGAENAIFGRFSRALEDEPEQSGMGLGLHIVKSIIERHGGTVQAEARDVGTRVVVTLPIESAP